MLLPKLNNWPGVVSTLPTSSSQLSLSQAMAYYREQWQLEHGFHRFKQGQLPAPPRISKV